LQQALALRRTFRVFPNWLVMIAVILFLAWAAGLSAAGWMTACGAFAVAASMPLLDYLTEYGVPRCFHGHTAGYADYGRSSSFDEARRALSNCRLGSTLDIARRR
jgi:hypothetical protein